MARSRRRWGDRISRSVARILLRVSSTTPRVPLESRRRAGFSGVVLGILLGGLWCVACGAQAQDRVVPNASYYAAFGYYYDGQYKDALEAFNDEWRRAIKTAQSRWIDSICYHTMMAECYYQMGQLEHALEQDTHALNLFLTFSDWMTRVQWPATLRPQSSAAFRPIPWGTSTRGAQVAQIKSSMLISQGQLITESVLRQGGAMQPLNLFPIGAAEIVRCTALAIRRRTELLGPVSRFDPLTARLIAALSQQLTPPNHWSQAWADHLRGLALLAGGKESEGVTLLKRSITAAGQFDHHLTCSALLELGRLELVRGNYEAAVKVLHEATLSAAMFEDYGILEEAFRHASLAYHLSNRKGVYPPLAPALQWVRSGARQLRVSLSLCAAEQQAAIGLTRDAAVRLEEAPSLIGRRPMGAGRIGARVNYLRALVLFQQKKMAAGDEALAAAMSYMQHGSLWLFHINLVDNRLPSFTSRAALGLYQDVLRDPQPRDWTLDPMESLAVLVTPHVGSYDSWFSVAMQRQSHDPEAALEIGERIRRHRYFTSLPFGGRLQALRWVLEAPPEALDPKAKLQRQDLVADHPEYEQLAQSAAKVRARLKTIPLVTHDAAAFQEQSQALGQLATISADQEAILRQMAVRRAPADMVFPPLRTMKEIQKGLPSGHAMMGFLVTGGQLHGFLLNQEKHRAWTVRNPGALARKMAAMLRDMGLHDQNREVTSKELADTAWKQSARQVLEALLEGSGADFSRQFPELVIVPDGLLWYLPFEALQVSVDKQLHPLIFRFRIRYAPTASLAVPDERNRNPAAPTVAVLGRLFPRDDESVAQAAFDGLAKVVPGAVAISKPPMPAVSSVYGSLMERLIVLDDIAPSEQDAYAWSPFQIDKSRQGNTLRDWLTLPFGGPEVIILPGFHTAAENSLKRPPRPAGSDMFLSVCGLMSCGARTILISRWRTGGQSAFDLVREFAQELPHATPSDAWQQAVLREADTQLDPETEPRLKRSSTEEPPKGNHPFFWAGYMLVDSGTSPQKREAAPVEKPAEPPKMPKPAEQKPGTDAEELPAKKPHGAKMPGNKRLPANAGRAKAAAKNGRAEKQEK